MKFEDGLKKLEGIVKTLDSGNIPLDEALNLFKDGLALTRDLSKRLDEIEKKVEVLIRKEDGSIGKKALRRGRRLMDLATYLREKQIVVEECLKDIFSSLKTSPAALRDSMGYSSFPTGKGYGRSSRSPRARPRGKARTTSCLSPVQLR